MWIHPSMENELRKRCSQRKNLFSASTPHYIFICMKLWSTVFSVSSPSHYSLKNDEVEENLMRPWFRASPLSLGFSKPVTRIPLVFLSVHLTRRRDGSVLCGLGAAMKMVHLWYGLVISCVYHMLEPLLLLFSRAESFFFFFIVCVFNMGYGINWTYSW